MAIDILITGDYKDRDIKRAQRDLDLLKTQSGVTGSAFAGLGKSTAALGGVIAGAFSVAVVADFFKTAIDGALADEVAMKSLAVALENVNQGYRSTDVNQFIDSLALASGVADDVLRPSLQALVTVTGNVTTSQNALKLALDVAAGSSKSVEEVSKALSAAYSGNFTAITRLKTGIDSNIIATKDMDKITAALSERYAGQASTAVNTYAGRLSQLSIIADEAKEQIGFALLDAVSDVADAMGGTGGAAQAAKEMANGLSGLIGNVGKALVVIAGLGTATGKTADIQDEYSTKTLRDLLALFGPITLGTRELMLANEEAARAEGEHAKSLQVITDRYKGLAAAAAGAAIAMEAAKRQQAVDATTDRLTALARTFEVTSIAFTGGNLATYFDDATAGASKFGGSASTAAEKVVVLTDRQQRLALTMAGSQVAVKQATEDLEAITKASDDYARSTTAAIEGTVSLSTAFGAALKASEEGSLAAGQTVAGATIANLKAQIDATKAFEASLDSILASGGSLALVDQLRQIALTQGVPAGTLLAGEVLTGGFVPELTALLTDFNVFATEAGTKMADNFFAQGITDAVALLNGLSTEVAAQQKELDRLGKNIGLPIAAAISEEIAQAIRDGIADGRAVAARRRAEAFAAASFVAVTAAPSAPAVISLSGGGMINIPRMAAGGPVTGGQPYLVGERGPELFVPGSNGNITPNNAMAGNTYQINVTAGVGDPRAIGQQIVEYVRKFEQANGPVFRAA